MTQFATIDLGINAGWPEGSNGWKAGMDYNLIALSFIARAKVQNKTTLDLPPNPTIGEDCFIVGSPATGALVGKENSIFFYGESWHEVLPWEGARFYDEATDQYLEFRAGSWIENSNYKLKIKEIAATAYTVIDSDTGKVLVFTAATAIALTVNANAGAAGFNFGVVQDGAGQITIGGSASLVNVDSHTKTFGIGAQVAFIGLGGGKVNYAGRTAL